MLRLPSGEKVIVSRRSVLAGAAGLALEAVTGDAIADRAMPIAYVSHGSPKLVSDAVRGAALRAWGASLPKPSGILVVTPHYAARALELGATGTGFAMFNLPRPLKRLLPPDAEYATPPSEGLARRVEARLGSTVRRSVDRKGFDHTTWIPLRHMFPAADIPVLEMTYPYAKEADQFALGKKLAPLRAEGVLLFLSGGMTHNLASTGGATDPLRGPSTDAEGAASPPSWSSEFDAWAARALETADVDALVDFRNKAPAADLAHPDDGGHFRALLVGQGFAIGSGTATPRARFPIIGFESTLSIRCVEIA